MEPTISAAIIVRDGEKHLERCLDSLKPLVDEYVIGVDNRTQDKTEEIARKFTDKIYYFSWEGFAAARNFLLPYIPTDWWIYVDHEEWLEAGDIPLIKGLIQSPELAAIACYQLSEKADGCALCQVPRIFRNGCVYFEGIKHNQPVISGGESVLKPIRIYHKGYDLSPEEMAAKHKRDEDLLLKQKAEKPGNISILRNLIRLYHAQRRYDDLIELAQPIWSLGTAGKSAQMIGVDLLSAYLAKRDYVQAEIIGLDLCEQFPEAIDGWYQMGILYHTQGQWKKCIDAFTRYLSNLHNLNQHPHFVPGIVDSWGSEWKAYELMAISCYELDRHWEAVDYFRSSVKKAKNWKKQREYLQIVLAAVADGEPLNILSVQPKPCHRNRKQTIALRKKGHKVTLAYTAEAHYDSDYIVGDIYDEAHKVETQDELLALCKQNDVVHVHNEPDTITLLLEEFAPDAIVIHDTHDMIQLRHPGTQLGPIAAVVNHRASGTIFTTPQQLYATKQFYDIDASRSLVLYNFASEDDLPDGGKTKLSAQDGQTHIVYEGSLMGMHRELRETFLILADMGYCVHIHPAFENETYARLAMDNERIYYYDPVDPGKVIYELTRYDYGIIPWNIENSQKEFLDTCIANKLFDYSAAGLPVIARRTAALEWFITEQNLGVVYDDISEIPHKIEEAQTNSVAPRIFTMESQINALIGFYRMLIRQKQQLRESFDNIIPDGIKRICLAEYETQHLQKNERSIEYAFIFRCLAKCYPDLILDVGTGKTALPSLMNTCGYRVIAIDNWDDYWFKTPLNRHWYIVNDSIVHPEKLDGKKFDFITCVSVLEHIEESDIAMANMIKLLKPEGYLALTIPYDERIYIDNIYDDPHFGVNKDEIYKRRIFSRAQVDNWLEQNDMDIVEQEYWETFEDGLAKARKRLPLPARATAYSKHDLTCLLIQRRS